MGDWSQGVPLGYLQELLCGYWADGYDWRATEGRLNRIPQFTTMIDGLDVHFLHVHSPHPGAVRLVNHESLERMRQLAALALEVFAN